MLLKLKVCLLLILVCLNLLAVPLLLDVLYVAGEIGFARAWANGVQDVVARPLRGINVLMGGQVT